MPTIDELLNNNDENEINDNEIFTPVEGYKQVLYEDENIINIVNKQIGDTEKQISVEGEANSQYLVFERERYVDGIDLNDKLLQIHYERQDGVGGNSVPVNVRISEYHIRFGWVIPPKAVAIDGILKIMPFVYGISPTGDTYILKDLYVEYVVHEGLAVSGGIEEPDEDWYLQFVSQMEKYVSDAKEYAENAKISKDNASISETNALQYKTDAQAYAEMAEIYKNNAAESLASIQDSETNSVQAALNAANSATNAALSATTADTKAQEALTSATNAKVSETNAQTSETNAALSATTADTKAQEALTSSQNASSSEINAKNSEVVAKASELSAVNSASTATEKATEATNSALNAANSATNAANSAIQATESAETAKQYSGNPAKPQNGTWWIWDAKNGQYKDTGIKSILSIVKSYPSVQAMEDDKVNMEEGDLVIIASNTEDVDNSKLYVHNGTDWIYLSDLSGLQGVGIANIERTYGDGTPGSLDIYTITLTDSREYTFSVYNGLDGVGTGDMSKSTYDTKNKNEDIFDYTDKGLQKKADLVDGKVPTEQLPDMDYIPTNEKGIASGVATLDTDGKVPSEQLPSMNYIPTSEKGIASGVATLDTNGKVSSEQLPSTDYIPTSEKGIASGVATLDTDGKVPSEQLPSMNYIPTSEKGIASGVATLDQNGKIPNTEIPSPEDFGALPLKGNALTATKATQDGNGNNIVNTYQTKIGDTANNVITFTSATSRTNISTGEKHSIIFGKINKWFSDLKTIAFTANYNDLTNKPISLKNPNSITINGKTYDGSSAVNIGTIGIAYGGTGASTASQALTNLGGLSTTGGTITGDLTITGNLKLKVPNSNFGNKINFGDGDLVYIHESSDNHLDIKAHYINIKLPDVTTTNRFTVNGGAVPILYGGTGASNASNARSNLGLGSAATKSATDSITSDSSALITSGAVYNALVNKAATNHNHNYNDLTNKPLSLKNPYSMMINGKTYDGSSTVNIGTIGMAYGGTGASNASNARSNLGLGSAATKSATDSITSDSSALITSGAVYNAKQELDNKINTINNDLNNFVPNRLNVFKIQNAHFTQYPTDYLSGVFSISIIYYHGNDERYDPPSKTTDIKVFNVLTFGTPGTYTRCTQIAFQSLLDVDENNKNAIFIRNQQDIRVSDWVKIN